MGQGNGTTNGPNGPINLPRFTWCSPFLWKIFSQIHKKIPEFSINTLTIIDYWKAAHWNEAVYIGATKTPKKIRRCQSGLRQHSRTNSCSRLWKQLIKNWSTWDLRGKPSRSWHGLNVANIVENVVDVVENDGKWWKMGILKPNPPIDFTWFHHCPRKIKEVWMSFDKRSAAGVLLPKRQLPRIPQFQHALKIAREPGNRLGTVWEPFRLQVCLLQSRAKHGGTPMVLRQTVTSWCCLRMVDTPIGHMGVSENVVYP